jgi:hypothetical protein
MRTRPFLLLFLLSIFLQNCASIQPPVGGPKDETPPHMDTLKSTPNYQVNFVKQPIKIVFNEWVQQPSDVAKEVVVSPPLRYPNNLLTLKGKTLIVEFNEKEELQPNVTYTINFGASIKDLSESNPAKDLRFVFATGPILDSLTVQGEVIAHADRKPLENILVMLYANTKDSVVKRERPLYFARTDKEGRFTIKNVRAGQFKAFALEDANQPYFYDVTSEKIGFLDSLVTTAAGQTPILKFELFTEKAPLRVVNTEHKRYGLVNVQMNRSPGQFEVGSNVPDMRFRSENNGDTLKVWYDGTAPGANWNLYIRQDSTFGDTLQIKTLAPATYLKTAKLLLNLANQKEPQRQNPDQPLVLTFNHPLTSFDPNQLILLEDTVRQVSPTLLEIDTLNSKQLKINYRWKEESRYLLKFAPNSVKDLYSLSFKDSVRYRILAQARKNYGNLDIKVEKMDSTQQYVLEIFRGEVAEPAFRIIINNSSKYRALYKNQEPGQYKMRLILDRNRNGRWDTGDYFKHLQPEALQSRDLEALRPNWDLDVTEIWGEVVKQ